MALRTRSRALRNGLEFELKTEKFAKMTQELAQAAGTELEDVVDFEVTRVLDTASRRTKTASKKKMIEYWRWRRRFTKIDGKLIQFHPGVSKKTGEVTNFRYADNLLWARAVVQREDEMNARIARIGTAASTWLEIARILRLPAQGKASARKILKRFGNPSIATGTRTNRGPGRYSHTIVNRSVLRFWLRFGVLLQKVINGRLGFFRRNFRSGVFRAANQVAAKYPGLRIRGGGGGGRSVVNY